MAEKKHPVVHCPTCNQLVEWNPDNRYRPFCSERCKLIDLGQWATEAYRIPTSEHEQESGQEPDNT